MELELFDFHIDDIQWGDRTSLAGGQLSLDLAEIQDQIKDLTRNINVAMELARPGESKRIVHVLDTMLPIDKLDDEAAHVSRYRSARPSSGNWTDAAIAQRADYHRRNVSSSGGDDPNREAPRRCDRYGRRRSPVFAWVGLFSSDSNAGRRAVDFKSGIRPGASNHRSAHCALSCRSGEKGATAPERRKLHLGPVHKKLPKVVLIYQIQSQIPLVRTFYYGEELSRTLPSFIHPNEFFDGAVVSGTYKSERKIPTSLHCAESFH